MRPKRCCAASGSTKARPTPPRRPPSPRPTRRKAPATRSSWASGRWSAPCCRPVRWRSEMADDAASRFKGPRIGDAHVRVDGHAKVTGQARYPADEPVANPAYAFLVTSAISRGRVRAFDLAAAQAVPGVLLILTHQNVAGAVKSPNGPDGKPTTTTLESDRV